MTELTAFTELHIYYVYSFHESSKVPEFDEEKKLQVPVALF